MARKFLIALAAFLALSLLLPSLGWGACNSVNETWRTAVCSYVPPLPSGFECPPAFPVYEPNAANYCVSSRPENIGGRTFEICTIRCSGRIEADSLVCVIAGNSWVNGGCVEPSKNDTTTYNALVNVCESEKVGGVAHYRYNNMGNVVGYCDVCQTDENGTPIAAVWKQSVQNHKDFCCSVGMSPEGSWDCKATVNGCYAKKCTWDLTTPIGIGAYVLGAGACQIDVSNSKPLGCDIQDSVSFDDLLGSSASEDTTQTNSSTSGDPIQDGLEAVLDSLHKIIIIDSTHRSIDSISMTYLWRIYDALENWERDTTIVNVSGDTIINNVNVNQSQVVSAVNDLERVLNSNALKDSARTDSTHKLLDGILNALKGDTLGGNGLDIIQSQIDSLLGFYGDTTGAVAAGDTAGLMGGLDSLGKWLKDSTLIGSIFGSGDGALCDTTKGEKCASLGGSLDSAASSYGTTAQALKDSLVGLVGDSLAQWDNALTNNGVISGSGSASCPAVLSKNYEVVIKNNVKFTYNLGKYLCYDVGLGITLWALARVLLRAMVAISCMWWLYRAVTGTDSGGNDD